MEYSGSVTFGDIAGAASDPYGAIAGMVPGGQAVYQLGKTFGAKPPGSYTVQHNAAGSAPVPGLGRELLDAATAARLFVPASASARPSWNQWAQPQFALFAAGWVQGRRLTDAQVSELARNLTLPTTSVGPLHPPSFAVLQSMLLKMRRVDLRANRGTVPARGGVVRKRQTTPMRTGPVVRRRETTPAAAPAYSGLPGGFVWNQQSGEIPPFPEPEPDPWNQQQGQIPPYTPPPYNPGPAPAPGPTVPANDPPEPAPAPASPGGVSPLLLLAGAGLVGYLLLK